MADFTRYPLNNALYRKGKKGKEGDCGLRRNDD
jgi:hypothetical protein